MKLVLSTFFLVLTISILNCARYDVEIASVLKKLETFNITSEDESVYETVPLEVFTWLTYADFDCIEEKLNIQNVDKRQLQDIKNLTEFESLNIENMKTFVAIGKAARICTRKSKKFKDAGIYEILTLRAFMAKLIFPDVRLNEARAEECFKWALGKVEPDSKLVEGFDVSTMNYSVSTCQQRTSVKTFRQDLAKQMKKLEINSCDVDTYEEPTQVGYNFMKMFLFSKVVDKIPEYREELSESVVNFEANLLETQMNCLLKDLREGL